MGWPALSSPAACLTRRLLRGTEMLNAEVARGPSGRVLAMDTITTKVAPGMEGCLVVSGSHGGTSSGEFALAVPLQLAVFNDAGVGRTTPASPRWPCVGHGAAPRWRWRTSARIGDALDAWQHG